MAAFLRWTFPHELSEKEQRERDEEKREKERVRAETGHDPTWPKGANLEICGEKFGALDRLQEKYVNKKETYGECSQNFPSKLGCTIREKANT